MPRYAGAMERLEFHGWDVTESGCWEWRGRRNWAGYGRLRYDGHETQAHRVSYIAFIGPIPDGMLIRHKCDNRPCMNPGHLEPGTHQQNSDDKHERGRSPRGNDHHQSKVTVDGVVDMRRRRAAGERVIDLAKEYGITDGAVSSICTGRTWKWLPLSHQE